MLVVDPKKRPSVSELLRDPWVQEYVFFSSLSILWWIVLDIIVYQVLSFTWFCNWFRGIEEFLEAEDSSSSTSSPQNFAEITQDELDNAYEETEEERLIETVEKTGTGNSK